MTDTFTGTTVPGGGGSPPPTGTTRPAAQSATDKKIANNPWDLTQIEIQQLSDEQLAQVRKALDNLTFAASSPLPSQRRLGIGLSKISAEEREKARKALDIANAEATRRRPPGFNPAPGEIPPFTRDKIQDYLDFGNQFDVIDPQTGAPNVNWQSAIIGQYANAGTPDRPRQTQAPPFGGLIVMDGLTVREAVARLKTMKGDQLYQVQHELYNAGFYDPQTGGPVWGTLTDETYLAFESFLRKALQNKDMALVEVLKLANAEAATLRSRTGAEAEAARRAVEGSATGATADERKATITVPSEEELSKLLDRLSEDLLSGHLPDSAKAQIIKSIQAESERTQRENLEFSMPSATTSSATSTGGATSTGIPELDAFMEALIQQESSGNPNAKNPYSGAEGLGQFMYWNDWAREAGVDPGDFSAENQRKVIAYKLKQYYRDFGNLHDVAIAWYAGPDRALRKPSWLDSPQANDHPSPNQYASDLVAEARRRLEAGDYPGGAPGGAAPGTTLTTRTVQRFDENLAAESAVKAADPVAYEGTRYVKKWLEFIDLIGVRSAQ